MDDRQKLDELKKLMKEVPLSECVIALRDRIQVSVNSPRDRAILVRYMEDAAAWIWQLHSGVLPPLPDPPKTIPPK